MGEADLRALSQKIKSLPIKRQLVFVTTFCLFFFPAYSLGLWRGAQAANPLVLALEWERGWPFLPWMILPYLSLFVAYAVPMFFIPAWKYPALTKQALMVVLVSALVFLLLPTQPGFVGEAEVPDTLRSLFALMHSVDAPRNLVPSLHVAGAAVVLLASADDAGPGWSLALRSWLALIAISTLFVHQHHLIDIALALALTLGVRRLAPLPADAS